MAHLGRRSVAVILCALLGGVAEASPVDAPQFTVSDPQAQADLDRGLSLDGIADYGGALAAFRTGYAIDLDPLFILLVGQEQRSLGHCDEAVQSYKTYLLNSPPPDLAAVANKGIAKCQPSPTSPPPLAPIAPSEGGIPARVWIAVGVASLGLISGVFGTIEHEHQVSVWNTEFSGMNQPNNPSQPCYWSGAPAGANGGCASDFNAISTYATLEWVSYGTAAAAGVVAGVLFWQARSSERASAGLEVGIGPGTGLTLGGEF